MKKTVSIILALVMIVCLAACGKKEENNGPGCYVTISNKGKLETSAMFVKLPNKDADNNLDDVLKAAFKAMGKENDYASAQTDYGLSLTKLCGDESGSFSYYINNETGFMDLTPVVKENDYVVAFVYADTIGWSDSYAFFDKFQAEGKEIELTLSASGFDANWAPVVAPLEGAVISIDGAATEFKTDAAGKVALSISGNGEHIVSASKEGVVIVPPVCVVTVK